MVGEVLALNVALFISCFGVCYNHTIGNLQTQNLFPFLLHSNQLISFIQRRLEEKIFDQITFVLALFTVMNFL